MHGIFSEDACVVVCWHFVSPFPWTAHLWWNHGLFFFCCSLFFFFLSCALFSLLLWPAARLSYWKVIICVDFISYWARVKGFQFAFSCKLSPATLKVIVILSNSFVWMKSMLIKCLYSLEDFRAFVFMIIISLLLGSFNGAWNVS